MSRTTRIFGGFSVGWVHLTLVTLVGLVLTPFLLDRVGRHDYGLWIVGLQLIGYLQLIDLGVVAMLPREAAYASGRSTMDAASDAWGQLASSIRLIIRWQWPLAGVAALTVWLCFPTQWEPLRTPFAWILACLVLLFPLRTRLALLQGLQDLTFLSQVQIAAWAAGTLVLVGLVLAGFGLSALAAGWILTQVITVAVCWWRVNRRFAQAWPRRVAAKATDAWAYMGRSIWVSVSQIAQVLLNGSDVLILGIVLGPEAAVPYACTAKLIQVLANHPQMLMQVAAPALSELTVVASRDRLFTTTTALARAMLVLSGAVAVTVVAANGAFVAWWVGADLFGGLALTCALVAAMILRHFNTTTAYALFCFGHERRLSLTALADGAVTVGTSIVFINAWGPIGAALGSAAGVLAVSILPNLKALAREIGTRTQTLVSLHRGWAFRFTAALAVSLLLARMTAGDSFWLAAGLAAAGFACYAALVFPLVLAGPLGGYVRQLLDAGPLAVLRRRTAPGDVL